MNLIDDEGRILGFVNVIDALAVLLVLAVVAAGAALVFSEPEPEPGHNIATENVTLDLGEQPDYIVAAISEGDSFSIGGENELTITDIHLAPTQNQTNVVLKVRLRGTTSGDTIQYDGAPPRLGRTITIQTSSYQVEGSIRDIDGDPTLDRTSTDVVLRTVVPAERAAQLKPGQEFRVADRTVATLEDVAVYETRDASERLVYLHATLETYREGDAIRFGSTPLRRGAEVVLPSARTPITASVQSIGDGIPRSTTKVLVSSTVSATTAEAMETGDTYRVAGNPVATIETLDVYGTQNPDRKLVYAGLSLRTLDYSQLPLFGNTSIRAGATVEFRTQEYGFTGNVERIGSAEQRGSPATRTVTLQWRNVPPELADAIQAGMTEIGAGTTIAEITGVERDPSTVIVTSQDGKIYQRDHPANKDLTITADLQVHQTTTGVTFKGRTIQQGATIVLDLGSVTLKATVVSF